MFDGKYDTSSDFDRVKYGVVNFTGDKNGVSVCKGYGNSYFLLKEQVRKRCTFTEMDSSNTVSILGSFKYPNHVLLKFSDAELKAAVSAAKGNPTPSTVTGTYK